ncbi:BT_3987 domain-containing protein [Pedobacter gandavensis]|uniref:BT_3987 domain-containing protein n=1 Tax=Pedobacter gandavensis TaxID=2679963 RepID=UPI00292D562F|nr:DUF1735 domain-containing protein [Pedobacter gandavensis]
MKSILKMAGLAVLGLSTMMACKKIAKPYEELTDSKEGAVVTITRFTGNNQNLTIFPYQDEARTVEFAAAFGALGLPAKNIKVSYAVDDKAFDSLNLQRVKMGLTAYQKFPTDAYQLSASSSTIPSGKVNSELIKLSYFSKKFNPTLDYLLPISITNADGYKIGANKTIFLIAPKLAEILADKIGWTATASSEELIGEGTANGKASFAIDGNNATYWHSKWQSPAPVFPHSLSINMQKELYVTRIELLARQNINSGFTEFNLEASLDGNTWTILGTGLIFDPLNKAAQSYPVTPGYWKHLKITAVKAASVATTSTHLAELNVYRY